MKYVVAVSGGVDSVVLLDMLATGKSSPLKKDNPLTGEISCSYVVAHFDHGIREDSAKDAEFVRSLAEKYDLPFETKREELGVGASEELARDRRYRFLRDVMKRHGAEAILTAHHKGDVVETVAINLTRGTGWRGLAVLDSPDILRPLLGFTKNELIEYAQRHELVWHEDSTNSDERYLRNKLRAKVDGISDDDKELVAKYHKRQVSLKREVDREVEQLLGDGPYQRNIFINSPEKPAIEILKVVLERETRQRFTRPQLHRALMQLKVLPGGKKYEVGQGAVLEIQKKTFTVKTDGRPRA